MPTKPKRERPQAKPRPITVKSTSALVKVVEKPEPGSRVVVRLVERRSTPRTYRISEVRDGYGHLSNGLGWIALRDTEEI